MLNSRNIPIRTLSSTGTILKSMSMSGRYIAGCSLPLSTQINTLFFYILWGFSNRKFLIQALIFRQIVNENVISIYHNLSLGVDKHKESSFDN